MPKRDHLDFLSESWHATRPEMDISPWQVWGRTTRLYELFLIRINAALSRHHLTFTEFQTLAALVLAGPPYRANPKQIARFNLLTSGGLANLLGRMEREGLVERSPDSTDKRAVTVQLTDRGLRAFNQAVVEENRIEHDMLGALCEEERDILGMLLRKLLLSNDSIGFNDPAAIQEPLDTATERPAAKLPGARRTARKSQQPQQRRTAPKAHA